MGEDWAKIDGVGAAFAAPCQALAVGASDDMDTPTSVYRYYDELGVLIYVGITSSGLSRNQQHNADKEWWPWVVSQSVDHHDTRDEAHAHEVRLIEKFRPPFNKQHNRDHAVVRAAYLAVRNGGVYDVPLNTHLPPELRKIDLDVVEVNPTEGTATLLSRPEHVQAVTRLEFMGPCPFKKGQNGKALGHITGMERVGPFARFLVEMRRGWTFTAAKLWIRPLDRKGRIRYELKLAYALDAVPVDWS
jgi:hypothetical protein